MTHSNSIQPSFPASIDSSMLATYATCPQLFYNQYCLHLTSPYSNPHLLAGSALAAALHTTREAFHIQHQSPTSAILAGLSTLTSTYGLYNPPPNAAHKSYQSIATAFISYFDKYPLTSDPYKPILPLPSSRSPFELSFSIPLPFFHPVTNRLLTFSGRIDQLSFHPTFHTPVILDEKTTRYLSHNFIETFFLRGQFLGYAFAVNTLFPHLPPASHFAVRAVALGGKLPAFETYTVRIHRHLITRWYENALSIIQSMLDNYQSVQTNRLSLATDHPNSPNLIATQNSQSHQHFPYAFNEACNAFHKPCSFTSSCRSRDPSLYYHYYARSSWNPINGVRTPLSPPLPSPHPPLPPSILKELNL